MPPEATDEPYYEQHKEDATEPKVRAPVGAKTARAARTRRATEDGQRGARPQALGGRNLRKVPPSATICHHLAAKSYPWPTLSLGLVEGYPYIWGSSLREGSVR